MWDIRQTSPVSRSAKGPRVQRFRAQGFTLIEVLVAVLVFGVIATAASEVASNYIGTYERIRDRTLATWIAENEITEMRLLENLPEISEETDEMDYANRRWQLETVVSATEDPRIRRVDVSVAVIVNDEARSLAQMTGFLGDY
ncbi:type II secretion system minor pseudopilin GspI [Marinobacter fonticola]|uniref:type II secretion system minor pseudopilin GspI n=1 Tax=Marinobacter fonticola TaxID=2603215 RepID=UPI0011E78B0A|nr:type II secretion system minor pseudopilin GspI [Marinobacter fonticola]